NPSAHVEEAAECLHWLRYFRCHYLVHDYTGAGTVRETVMHQAGIPAHQIIPIALIGPVMKDLIKWQKPLPDHSRGYYTLDKPRSLLFTCTALRLGLVETFTYDRKPDNSGLMSDFMALVQRKLERPATRDLYLIDCMAERSDDFAQAVNLACAWIWHTTGTWPDFARTYLSKHPINQVIDATQEKAYGHSGYGWEQNPQDVN
ncbi:MAG TPA: hypothetical protein VN719_04115, partial [Gemmatimonadales bacterium]|nr:hypothetical protein [Gemmatimonadales bacterium]